MTGLHYRGDGTGRPAGLPLPPQRLPWLARSRRLRLGKSWRYVSVWSPQVSLCVASVQVGPVPQEFWAVWDRSTGQLTERTRRWKGRVDVTPGRVVVRDGEAHVELTLDEGPETAFEVVTPVDGAWTWTRKQAVRAYGVARVGDSVTEVDGVALVDENAGYHPRRTAWQWCGGCGTTSDGRRVAWSVIVGLNDRPPHTENTVWVDGAPHQIGDVRFGQDLSEVEFDDGSRRGFSEEAARERSDNLLLVRSSYRQPFGRFTGTLPGGLSITGGHGVMERHDALW
ncbi:DUF2804 family protein [Motilibacter aurantiacus]|uniref:DUF2804 family protein n=1 Tax=Motilibacter aurantiacus TaxID=2714955 RepID=UPI001408A1C7|nr:DUF2804 family protein [Motilibacter aurantiacus]NHC44813.1 DUF2804 family protein [Motilibacter aurantiacus]